MTEPHYYPAIDLQGQSVSAIGIAPAKAVGERTLRRLARLRCYLATKETTEELPILGSTTVGNRLAICFTECGPATAWPDVTLAELGGLLAALGRAAGTGLFVPDQILADGFCPCRRGFLLVVDAERSGIAADGGGFAAQLCALILGRFGLAASDLSAGRSPLVDNRFMLAGELMAGLRVLGIGSVAGEKPQAAQPVRAWDAVEKAGVCLLEGRQLVECEAARRIKLVRQARRRSLRARIQTALLRHRLGLGIGVTVVLLAALLAGPALAKRLGPPATLGLSADQVVVGFYQAVNDLDIEGLTRMLLSRKASPFADSLFAPAVSRAIRLGVERRDPLVPVRLLPDADTPDNDQIMPGQAVPDGQLTGDFALPAQMLWGAANLVIIRLEHSPDDTLEATVRYDWHEEGTVTHRIDRLRLIRHREAWLIDEHSLDIADSELGTQ